MAMRERWKSGMVLSGTNLLIPELLQLQFVPDDRCRPANSQRNKKSWYFFLGT